MRWKTLRDGFVRHLKKKKTLEMYTAAAAMRPYKLEKQIAFLMPHVSFRDEDGDGGSNEDDDDDDDDHHHDRCNDDDTTASSSADLHQKTNDCDPVAAATAAYDQQMAAEMLYEQSNMMDKTCSEHDALDRSIHFLCDQRYKAAATNYK